MDEAVYAHELDAKLTLLRTEDFWREAELRVKCDAIETAVTEIAMRCQENGNQYDTNVHEWSRDRFCKAKELMNLRRQARRHGTRDEVTDLSKKIQKEVKMAMRAKNT